jgi:hypothetical protein
MFNTLNKTNVDFFSLSDFYLFFKKTSITARPFGLAAIPGCQASFDQNYIGK